MPASFIDTNVLVYLASDDAAKADRSQALVAEGGIVSVQVLNELANVSRRKMRLSWDETLEFVGPLRELFEVRPLSADTHAAGLELGRRFGLSVYDAMILASALEARCDVLWSEDLQHGLRIGSLRVLNPFRPIEEGGTGSSGTRGGPDR